MRLRWFGLLGFASLNLSCSGETATAPRDGGAPEAPPTDIAPVTCPARTFEAGSEEGAAEPLAVPAGAARAGRLEASELPASRSGLSYARAGDYVLANERVALIVEGARTSDGYNPWGGGPAGVARVEGGRLVDAGDFNEMMFGLGRYTVATERVTVLRDGSAGGPAVVRAAGPMRPIPFIDEFGRSIVRADYNDVNLALDYELAPGAEHVDVYATFDVRNGDGYDARFVTNAFFQGYRMTRFIPGYGFFQTGDGVSPPAAQAVAWVDDEATSWAWQVPSGSLQQFISISGFDLFNAPALQLRPCTMPLERVLVGRIVIGGRGLDGLQQAVARQAGRRLREVRVTVNDAAGAPAAGVRVHASLRRAAPMPDAGMQQIQEELTRGTTDAMGAVTLHVPEGMAVELTAYRRGDAVPSPATVGAADATATLRLGPSGSIHVVATEVGATPPGVPARVQVLPMGAEVPSVPETFGEPEMPAGRLHVEFPVTGEATLRAPPGRYRVVVSRGYEYDLSDTTVTVAAGMTAEVRAELRRVVETPGVQCGDFHIHTTRSPDSRDSARYKLASAAADGLEVAARSDHEYVAEWASIVRDMGLDRWVFGLTSLEFTTFAWGHFGVFPLEPDPARRNAGVFDWAGRLPPAVFADVRARREQPALVINHPRGAAISGYFTAAGYDPATGTARRADMWDDRFTAIEVFNDSGPYDDGNRANVTDWFSFLNRNQRKFAVGSSDSHSILGGSPVGFPRTCMYLGTDDPRMATPNGIRDAVANGRSYISGGVYIDVTASPAAGGAASAGPGQELRGAGAMARLQVRVQAAPWVTVDRLEVLTNGPLDGDAGRNGSTVVQTVTLDASRRDPMNPTVRFRGDVMVPVPAEGFGWAVVAVRGAELAPVHPRRNAFGVTNPIFLQR